MAEVECKAGDWIVYNSERYYGPAFKVGLVEKRTPKQVRVSQSWEKVVSPISVLAALPDKERAEQLKQALDGAAGTFNERRRKAEEVRSESITKAREALAKSVEQIISRATQGDTP